MGQKVVSILKQAFERKKLGNENYSLSLLAKKLNLSRAFVSSLFTGKKNIPFERIDDLIMALDMDDLSVENFMAALHEDFQTEIISASSKLKKLARKVKSPRLNVLSQYKEIPIKKMSHLSPWYNVAIMDMLALDNFNPTPEAISKRLGIDRQLIEKSWNYLVENKLIENKEGRWQKTHRKVRIPTLQTEEAIRNYHESLILRGLNVLKTRTTSKDFSQRLITGVTLSANTQNIDKVKIFLTEQQYEAAEILREGECDEVYQIQIMLFPITR